MKFLLKMAAVAGTLLSALAPTLAQTSDGAQRAELPTLSPTPAVKRLQAEAAARGVTEDAAATAISKLRVFKYTFTSPRDGQSYSGSVVGADPRKTTGLDATIPVVLIPLRVELTGATNYAFDPTSLDTGCIGGKTALKLTQQSNIFKAVPNYTINGQNMGKVTFIDAFQRAQFWQDASGNPLVQSKTGYHLHMNVTVAPKQTVALATAGGSKAFVYVPSTTCSSNAIGQDNPPVLGIVNINNLDPLLNQIIGNLGITPDQFPLFIIYGTVISNGTASNLNNCCILGYHNGSGVVSNPGQTYGIAEYDQGYLFGAGTKNVSVLSHEVLEWANDPSTNNLVPAWGGIGQVGGCQGNLETGDPMSGTLMPPVVMPNGVSYSAQENAFFSWFMGPVFTGAGGKFSSNGTFGGNARPCPPGGTF